MRIPREYSYPILTAIMFPVALVGTMWALDLYSQWLRENHVEVARSRAVTIASSQCFSRSPPSFPIGKWGHARIENDHWVVWMDDTPLDWRWGAGPGATMPASIAVIDPHTGFLARCIFAAADF